MDKQRVVDLWRTAEKNLAVRPEAEEALARFVLRVAHEEAGEGADRSFVEEGGNRAFIRLQTRILVQEKPDPEHVVNLAEFIVRGGYPPGQTYRIPGIFEIMRREERAARSRTVSLSEPICHGEDSEGEPSTVEEVTPNLAVIAPPVGAEVNRETERWVEELARAAEAQPDRVKRETLNALLLYLKHGVALCNGRSAASLYESTTLPVETLLAAANLSGLHVELFDKTKSQWMMKRDVWQFLGTIMELFIKAYVEKDPKPYFRKIQNTVRQRVNRVLPILDGIRMCCASDVFGVEEICRDRNLHPEGEVADEGVEQ